MSSIKDILLIDDQLSLIFSDFLLLLIVVRFCGCLWYSMFAFQRIQPFVPVKIGNSNEQAACTGNEQKFYILIVAGTTAAHGEQYGPEQATGS